MKKVGPIPLYATLVGIFLLCLIIEALIFGPYLWSPNEYVFSYGGDALVIYYDMVYHICHGHGYIFDGMNYPYGESLFMTDANASFTILLSYLNRWIPLCHMVPGLLHGFILYLLPLTAIFSFLTLRELRVSYQSSLIFSILITFLSPQLLRILGHFGLAFPFIIPMVIYWFVTRIDSAKPKYTDVIYFVTLIFFTLNNPYLGIAASGLLSLAGIIRMFNNKMNGLYILMMGFIPALLSYLIIDFTDPFDDRIQMQWGFFYYFTSLQGIFFPNGSLLYNILDVFTEPPSVRFEGRINLGLVTTLTLISITLLFIAGRTLNKAISVPLLPYELKVLFIAGLFMFLYAANYSLYGFAKPFLEEHMGPLLMFKASGRMAWPFYYVATLLAVYCCDMLWKGKRNAGKVLYILAIIIWIYEAYDMNNRRFEDIHHGNPFINQELMAEVDELEIDTSQYQSLYMLPVTQSWNDKFLFPVHWQTQYSGMLLSAISGIPHINAMVSRAPVTSSVTSIQLASDPYIQRERIKDLDLSKPILLVLGDKHPALTIGEQYLIDSSTLVGRFAKSTLYALDLNKIKIPKYTDDPRDILIAEDFDPKGNPRFGLNDNFCKQTTPDNNLIWKGKFSSAVQADSLQIILWYYLYPETFQNPQISVITGNKTYNFYDRASRNMKDNWVQQSISIPYSNSLEIRALGDKIFVFDSLTIKTY